MNQRPGRERSPRRWILRLPLFGLSLLPLVSAALTPSQASAGAVLPTGGQVVAGAAAIVAPAGSSLNINQTSAKAIIDWSGFSIGSGGTVQFNNGSGATLNRVTGATVSSIDGTLSATGSVYLINPNGVIIGKNGVVQVGGSFVASILDVSDAAFLAGGDLTFAGPSGAGVVNLGRIGALGGDVALIGAVVENDGSISAANGSASLIAGHGVLMRDLAVDAGRFAVLVGGSDTSAANTGTIQAAEAELRAEGGNVYALAGNTAGVIRAAGVSSGGGKVFLVADGGDLTVGGVVEAQTATGAGGAITLDAGQVTIDKGATLSVASATGAGGAVSITGNLVFNSGTLDAPGLDGGAVTIAAQSIVSDGVVEVSGSRGAGGSYLANATQSYVETTGGDIQANGATSGGTIQVEAGSSLFTSGAWSAAGGSGAGGVITALGHAVTLADASFNATGAAGGSIRVGGDFHGAGDLSQATTTTVTTGSVLDASATSGAGGGSLVVWSSSQTAFFGTASAKGAGDIEISSAGGLIMGGLADAGVGGQILFDPQYITIAASAASYPQYQLIDPDPSAADGFGAQVAKLSNGNLVVTSPYDTAGGAASGAVYLFSGSTDALISTLTGSGAYEDVGFGGVTVLTNGNYVISSPSWANGSTALVGAATWGSATAGITGAVSSSNSLVGSQAGDHVSSGGVVALPNGGYAVLSPSWANGGYTSAGAVTWSGATGITGPISTSNSLTGSTTNDQVGSGAPGVPGLTILANGDYVVDSPYWNGAIGAVTWVNSASPIVGVVATTNSLTGTRASDSVGVGGITALPNGDYVVDSPNWANGSSNPLAGAVTWANGNGGTVGAVSTSNSLTGSVSGDEVGSQGVTVLTNGNYVVASPFWASGLGAVTWGSGAAGVKGVVSATNSLVGSTTTDNVGSGGVTALANGDYVVDSPQWSSGATTYVGSVTWANGSVGLAGVVSTSNSLTGSSSLDQVGVGGVTALTNGNYVVDSYYWSNGLGAVTWGNGASGTTGSVTTANSLTGSHPGDEVGWGDSVGVGGVTALTNGNYVVDSSTWNGGVGAVTWGGGLTGVNGVVSAGNSLVGSATTDNVGGGGVTALTNGNYVVDSPSWNGAIGAVTWANGAAGLAGAVGTSNSLTGSSSGDSVGLGGVFALTNGNYVVDSENWSSGGATDGGAVTWANGATGLAGAVSTSNSLTGSDYHDFVGGGGVTVLSNGNYIVDSPTWNGAASGAGAVTLGDGVYGTTTGAVSAANSLVGTQIGEGLLSFKIPSDTTNFVAVSSATDQVFVGLSDLNGLTYGLLQGANVTITPSMLAAELATGSSVTLQANDDITVSSALSVAGSAPGALTLDAGRSILLNASISTNGVLYLLANAPLSAGVVDAERDPGAAVITMAPGVAINAGPGMGGVDIEMANGAGKTNATSGAISLTSINGGEIKISNGGTSPGSNIVVSGALTTVCSAVCGAWLIGNGTGPADYGVDMQLTTAAGGITVSGALNAVDGLALTSAGSINASGGTLNTPSLYGSSVGGANLTGSGNLIGTLGWFSNTGSGAFSLSDGEALSVTGPVSDTAGALSLTTTTGGMTISGTVDATGQTLSLTSAGSIAAGSGTLKAASLTGSSVGGADLSDMLNWIVSLGSFTNTGGAFNFFTGLPLSLASGFSNTGGDLTLGSGGSLTLGGVVDATGHTLSLGSGSTLNASGTTLKAATLTGFANGTATLTGSNTFGTLGAFTDTAGAVSLNDGTALSITGVVNAGANTLTLTDAHTVAESGSGTIQAGTFTGSSVGGATLTGSGNLIGTLGSFSNTGSGAFSLVDAQSLSVTGPVSDTVANIALTTTTGGLTVGGTVDATGHMLTLVSAGAIGGSSGTLKASTLTGSSVGGAALTGAGNLIGTLGSFSNTGSGGFSLTDAQSLSVTGPVSATAGDMTLKTTSGGDLTIAAPISWSSANTLTLDSYHSVLVDAAITATGAGKAVLTTNDGGAGGVLSFSLTPSGFTGSLSFTGTPNTGQSLTINGQAYTLLYSMTDVANIGAGLGGDYALAKPVNATGTTYTNAVVTGTFTGSFNGLGNTISNLSIDAPSTTNVGLFAVMGASAVVSSVGLAGVNVTGGTDVGALVGQTSGTIGASIVASGSVNGATWTGGLVGVNYGAVNSSSSFVAVSGANGTGGLAGYNDGTVGGSSAGTGAVGGSNFVGGLVGWNDAGGTLSGDSVAGANVSAVTYDGGLVGYNLGSITNSSAADTVIGTGSAFATGGLVGANAASATLSGDSASGSVSGGVTWTGGLAGVNLGTINAGSSASGAVGGASGVGGLVGYNSGSISAASAGTGSISGSTFAVGGLVGLNDTAGTVAGDTATGTVNGVGAWTGGLVGVNYGTVNGGSSASGQITGAAGTGGLAGYNVGSITGSTAGTGSVSGTLFVGGLAGWNDVGGVLGNDSVTGATVTGGAEVGGLVGYNLASIISSTSADTVIGTGSGFAIGGLVGWNGASASLSGDSASGGVSGGVNWTGGLVGVNLGAINGGSSASGAVGGVTGVGGLAGYNDGTISGSSTSGGSVGGTNFVGGLVGENDGGGTIGGGTSSRTVTGSGAWTGGLAGVNYGTINAGSSASGTVNGTNGAGGLVGYNTGSISVAFATGAVTGVGANTGGLVGGNVGGTITNTYELGSVSGSSHVGGLIGSNAGAIGASYADGAVSGSSTTGGAIGANQTGATAQNVYWDVSTTGQAAATGSNAGTLTNVLGVGGSTGRNPYAQATYAGFDFVNVWSINAGTSRPYLKGVPASTPPP